LHSLTTTLLKPTEEVLTFDKSDATEMERLREENKRLKRTLVERFDH
jgi:hypothetical protein